jgi:hypothetical protein
MTEEKQEISEKIPAPEAVEPQETAKEARETPEKPQTLRQTIVAAQKEAKAKAEAEEAPPEKPGKEAPPEKAKDADEKAPAAKAAESPAEKGKPEQADKPQKADAQSEDSTETPAKVETQSQTKPPASWSKSARSQWDSLPPSIQDEVLRRETDTARGVDELKRRHEAELREWKSRNTDLDEAVRPYEEAIRLSGQTKGQAVDALFRWHVALSGPNKNEAFRVLAQSFGVDTTQFAGSRSAQPQDGQSEQFSQPVVDYSWMPAIDGVARRLERFEQMNAAQQQASAEQIVANWSRDKPHFERVRGLMAQFVDSDAKMGGSRFLKNGQIDMDAAYEAAVWADPEVRAEILREQQDKAEAAARGAAEKIKAEAEARLRQEKERSAAERAKRAAASLRPGAPVSGLNGASPSAVPSRETVRESIKRALSGM